MMSDCLFPLLQTPKSSELQASLKGDHARSAVTSQPNSEQAGGGRSRVRERSESRLGRGLTRNAGLHNAWQGEIRVVEDIEKLTFKPQLQVFCQREPFRQVKVTPEKIRAAQ